MISFAKKITKYAAAYAVAAAAIAAAALCFESYYISHIANLNEIPVPPPSCSQPIIYSIGTFDTGFGLTKAQFLDDINQAVQIWDGPFNRTFFVLASSSGRTVGSTGDLKINLIYDYRQQATDAMNALGVSLDDETTVYNALGEKYDSLTSAYAAQKASLAGVESSFAEAQTSYNQTVAYWNNQGGAPASEYAQLNQEKAALQSQADAITAEENAMNVSVVTINSIASTVNKYATLLNGKTTQYAAIASSTGEEFDEGEYVEDATGHHIDIFQYSNQTELIRVLAHELGHSLGLGHSYTNPQAIMYPLNQGTDLALAPEDIAALDAVCGIK